MNEKNFYVLHKNFLNISISFDCGQAFRWRVSPDGIITGVAFGKVIKIEERENEAVFYGTDEKEFGDIWAKYLDLGRDYGAICRSFESDRYLRQAVRAYPGIRILRQEPWEALCSFIISQNNNIPRIKGIIERLCETLGDDLGGGFYSFPSPEKVLAAGAQGLAPLRAGFRVKYILDAAAKVCDGTVDFDRIDKAGLEEAAEELKTIKGVGDKVAACALLYGFGKVDALPVDTWVKKILAETYPDGLPACTQGVRGIAQQYLFHYKRMNG